MPELPEVETIVRGLRDAIEDKRILDIAVYRSDILVNADPQQLCNYLPGQVIKQVSRRGKYIVMLMGNGSRLVTHLRMTGAYRLMAADEPPVPYLRLCFVLEGGTRLGYADKRALGRLWLYPPDETPTVLSSLGIEPLSTDFTLEKLQELLQENRRRVIKPLLLDQAVITGIGNIYASEILHRAGIHPARRPDDIAPEELARLYEAIRTVLDEAIVNQGTHISDFAGPEGHTGNFVNLLRVYQKAGESCPRCGETVLRMVQQQRSTYWCPGCQR